VRTSEATRGAYHRLIEVSTCELELKAFIDGQYLRTPFYSSRWMAAWPQAQGHAVNSKRVRHLI